MKSKNLRKFVPLAQYYCSDQIKQDEMDCTCRGGARGSVVVKALRYKPEGRGFDTRWGEFLNLPNPSGLTRPWG
jgi:hypothetical protein